MKQPNYSFESQKLQVDYITLNLKNGKNKIQKIAQFFNRYHRFNCYSVDHQLGRSSKKPYLNLINPSYELEMTFVYNSNRHNRNTILIQFSGLNGYHFYSILKSQQFNWKIFNLDDLALGRIDISYIRSNQRIHRSNLLDFFERSADKFKTKYTNAIPEKFDSSLGLGTRRGDYFLRVYLMKDDSLKFELEFKKFKTRQLTPFLIHHNFIDFENSIVESYFRYLKGGLVFDTCYTDWLLMRLRKTNKPPNHLISNYFSKKLVTDSMDDKRTFYRILQFLSFSRTCDFKKEILNDESYYTFSFPLITFARKINLYPLNSYQRKNLVKFFYELQGLPSVIYWFSDSEFRSILLCPVIRIENKTSKHTKLMIHITISEYFYNFQPPFSFPKSFYTFENKYDFQLKFAIIEAVCDELSIRKILDLEELLNSLNNKNKTFLKEKIIQQFQYLTNGKFIQNNFELVQKDNRIIQVNINHLTKQLINTTKQLIFYERIK